MARSSFAFLAALCCTVLLGTAAVSQSVDVGESTEFGFRDRNRDLNLGLATTEPVLVDGSNAVFTVSEAAQRRDLNGDGDMDDTVLQVFDALTGKVRNLGLSSTTNVFQTLFQGRVLAFLAQEGAVDLNGDGDTSDGVWHIYDTATGSLTNLRLAAGLFSFNPPFTDGRRVVFAVEESSQAKDLNRDGDRFDTVPHIFDLVTGRIQNVGLAGFLTLGGRWIPVSVYEGGTAIGDDGTISEGVDLNDNGKNFDNVLHLFDTVTGRATNLRLSAESSRGGDPGTLGAGFNVGGGEALAVISESRQLVDLNGDNDIADAILHRIELASGRVTNTRIAVASAGQGNVFPSLGPTPIPFAFHEGLAIFNLAEADQGKDLNGDGDTKDVLLHTLSTRTGRLQNLNVSASLFPSESTPGRVILFMSENDNARDLNGDGDIGSSEFVMGLADLNGRELRFVNTGLAISTLPTNGDDGNIFLVDGTALQIAGNFVTFLVPEAVQGNRDLNGDGDTVDNVLHIADLTTFTTRSTGLSGASAYRAIQAPLLPASDGRAMVPVNESRQGRDLNGDGDFADNVLQSLDVRSGRSRNTGIAVAGESFFAVTAFDCPLMIRGETFVSLLLQEGSNDLNSDGDTTDLVLHILDVATGRLTNLGRAAGTSTPPESELDLDFSFAGMAPTQGPLSGFAGPSVPADDGAGLGDAYVFLVSESAQGNIDLNGDGDTDDKVVHATRLTDRDRNGRFDFIEESARRAGRDSQ